MDRSCFRHRFAMILLLAGTAALAGCSGSGSSTTAGDGNDRSPVLQPPTDDPSAGDPPADTPGDPTAQVPEVNLSALEPVIPAGDTVVLTWNSSDATSCTASGGWTGTKPTQGSAEVGPLNESTTFSLSCTGTGGASLDMLSVSVLGVVALHWEPPTENVDGTAIDDLDGFRIYYGTLSGNYTEELLVDDEEVTDYELSLPSGSYYFAMTALDAEGNESTYSNEVEKTVN